MDEQALLRALLPRPRAGEGGPRTGASAGPEAGGALWGPADDDERRDVLAAVLAWAGQPG